MSTTDFYHFKVKDRIRNYWFGNIRTINQIKYDENGKNKLLILDNGMSITLNQYLRHWEIRGI